MRVALSALRILAIMGDIPMGGMMRTGEEQAMRLVMSMIRAIWDMTLDE